MAQRAPDLVEGDDPLTAIYRQLDFFPTPPWAGRAIGELIKSLDPEAASVWEPACGQGHMAVPLSEYFLVFASDVYPHGFGSVIDFLADEDDDPSQGVDWIVSNPPFKAAADFIRIALKRARRGVAMLLRFQFLEGAGRYQLLYGGDTPMTVFAPFIERVPMALGKWDPELSSATGYGLFVWMKGAAPMPIRPFPPGTRDRLWRSDDPANFAHEREAPLLSAMGGLPPRNRGRGGWA
jgi:hypothetical protein